MRTLIIVLAGICFFAASAARADALMESVQKALKDQGFYYGEVSGRKDADTTAAIRRYQIRNGLQITGELNAETQKSLGLKGNVAARPSAPSPPPAQRPPPREDSDLRDDSREEDDDPGLAQNGFRRPPQPAPAPGYPPGSRGLQPEASGIFEGTPYDVAPPELQRRVVMGAQSLLGRRGYYRDVIDGLYGPGTEFAVRAFQARFGIEQNGRLDMETLAALGLLPGQQAPGVTAPRRRVVRPRFGTPNGERIYIPR